MSVVQKTGWILALALLINSMAGPTSVSAQCWDCFDDTQGNQHRMSFFEVEHLGWQDEGDHHTNNLPGYCIFNHSAGCEAAEEDALELASALPTLDGEALLEFVGKHGDSLDVLASESLVGVKGCGGRVAFWIELTPGQTKVLAASP